MAAGEVQMSGQMLEVADDAGDRTRVALGPLGRELLGVARAWATAGAPGSASTSSKIAQKSALNSAASGLDTFARAFQERCTRQR